MRIDGKGFSIHFDDKGNIQKVIFQDRVFEPPLGYTLYEINGEVADVSEMLSEKTPFLRLTTEKASGRNYFTGSRGAPLDFITFHMKGGPSGRLGEFSNPWEATDYERRGPSPPTL